ncbi:MAG: hypothetical protein ABF672_09995 [Gluconobacter oxydans]|uniref:hypothetical protein n=1 Tax=Gluconobacter oxydans TaxID=442 RepID=UPI0039ED3DED
MQEQRTLSAEIPLFPLLASATIPVSHFAARATRQTLSLSTEHTITKTLAST